MKRGSSVFLVQYCVMLHFIANRLLYPKNEKKKKTYFQNSLKDNSALCEVNC